MVWVLDLDPVRTATAAISALGVFRHQSLEAQVAGRAEQLGADLTELIGRGERDS